MKTVTKIFGILTAIAAMSLVYSCDDEVKWDGVGEEDVDGCYGVYFPTQDTELSLDPDADLTYTISVMRTNSSETIAVPLTLQDTSGIFSVSDLIFEDGQSESSIEITFSGAEIGTTYECTIGIEDPLYASIYNSNAPSIDFSVIRERWNSLGNATYTEDFLTTFWNVGNLSYEVEIRENDSKPGLFRLVNPYGEVYYWNDPGDWDDSQDYYLEIDATDRDGVFINLQNTGLDWGYGYVYVYSYAAYLMDYYGYDLDTVKGSGYCGTYADGVITFPTQALLIYMPGYSSNLYYANTNGAFMVVMPGTVLTDYSISIEAGETSNGEIPIYFTTGADVDTLKYAVYEGALNSTAISDNTNSIISGKEESVKTAESDTLALSFEETGIYTIIAVTYNKDGEAQESESLSFGYVTNGDSVPVSISCGIVATGKYGENYSSDNTIEYYIYGSDITDAKMLLIDTDTYEADEAAALESLYNEPSLSESAISSINSEYYAGIYADLTPGTSYTFLVWAFNGYESTVTSATASTTGVLQVELEDMIGTYTVTTNSYFYGEDTETWVIAASDDSTKGNIMLTSFCGVTMSSGYYIYATLDTDSNTITFEDEQLFRSGNTYDYYFVNASDSAPVTFNVIGKGKFTGPTDCYYGIYYCNAGTTEGAGWYDVLMSASGKKTSTSVSASSIQNVMAVKDIYAGSVKFSKVALRPVSGVEVFLDIERPHTAGQPALFTARPIKGPKTINKRAIERGPVFISK